MPELRRRRAGLPAARSRTAREPAAARSRTAREPAAARSRTAREPAAARRQAAQHRQRGSMTVEFVLLAPLLLGLMLFLVLAGRVVEAHGEADGAARDAARAASVARSLGAAQAAADQAVSSDVRGQCQLPVVQGYAPGSTAVTVTLHCQLDLSFIGYATVNVNGFAVAPLDQFVARTY